MIHIIVGEEGAQKLGEAFLLDENLQGEVLVLQDKLDIGSLQIEEEKNHDDARNEVWKKISMFHENTIQDRNQLKLLIAKALREEEPVCMWLAPNASDVCAYYWLLPYFKAYPEVLHTINIIGLPFLNEKGQLFYPSHFGQIPAKEFLKTKRLLKEVTLSEYEVDGDEWKRLQDDDEVLRLYDGGKKVSSKPAHHFDILIKNSITTEFQKGSKVVNETLKKINHSFHPAYIEWRLRELITDESITYQGDTNKTSKDFEVKKVGKPEEVIEEA